MVLNGKIISKHCFFLKLNEELKKVVLQLEEKTKEEIDIVFIRSQKKKGKTVT